MIGQVHELIQQVGLPHFRGQRAQLLVRCQAAATRGVPQLPILEDPGFACHLDRTSLLRAACMPRQSLGLPLD